VIAFDKRRATLVEIAPGVSVEQVIEATEAELVVRGDVPTMQL
jgi:acyl CoA:acetate/3-ketoacid CoA transferase beta subunit